MAPDEALYKKIATRLIPFMMLLYLIAFLDRVNISFAALTMNADLGFSPTVYGWGAGIFFIGYFLFEVPSNLILERVGARLWIFRIMVTWGLISAAMAFVQGPVSFFTLRFLLGVAEAGFLPGMILYLTTWFPQARLARFVGLFMMAVPLASAIGAPISSLILLSDGVLGLRGWQWLFIIEGLPACVLGFAVLALLPDGPASAPWLNDQERAIISARLAEDRARHGRVHTAFGPAMVDGRVWLLCLTYFGIVVGLYGVGLWLPQLIRGLGFSIAQVGVLTALPYLASAAAMLAWGPAQRPPGRTHPPRGAADAARRRGPRRRNRPARGLGGTRRARRSDRRHLCDARTVLGPAADLPHQHGRSRRHRADQFGRQSRRLSRAVDRRLDAGADPQLPRRACRHRRVPRAVRGRGAAGRIPHRSGSARRRRRHALLTSAPGGSFGRILSGCVSRGVAVLFLIA